MTDHDLIQEAVPLLFLEEVCTLILLCAGSQPLQQSLCSFWYSCVYLLLQVKPYSAKQCSSLVSGPHYYNDNML